MALNPGTREWLDPAVIFLEHACSSQWTLEPRSLDLVFSSNFFEHLPSRDHLLRTLGYAFEALKTGGILVALGPNIRYIPGAYWDFFDHYLPLSDASLCEAMRIQGFEIERVEPKFLAYTMSRGIRYPLPGGLSYYDAVGAVENPLLVPKSRLLNVDVRTENVPCLDLEDLPQLIGKGFPLVVDVRFVSHPEDPH